MSIWTLCNDLAARWSYGGEVSRLPLPNTRLAMSARRNTLELGDDVTGELATLAELYDRSEVETA